MGTPPAVLCIYERALNSLATSDPNAGGFSLQVGKWE